MTSREELQRLPQGPKVVLATLPSLEAGPARRLFAEWAGGRRNAVVFVTQPEVGVFFGGGAKGGGDCGVGWGDG